ncbi:unnamed protein product [Pocillopora meandrina]|uniref:Late endosomal/lysosomal adaptor and MAPK and MTOR activator 5 n=2 Tax=Pocillopora TaxID=46730 RepID=A0AAU9WHI3_9CNID|nr:ragulator complex protein LAMTOR5 homolog [Pocillopora verrucosa]CAH3112674.1 unnamed protein product [Pocillopora meandrina]
MEKSLDSHLDDIMSEHGVIGVLCSDQQGLALSAKGTANPMYAGLISSLAENAKQIYPDRVPVICLESDACNLLVRSEGNVTVAIHKVPS